MFETIKEIILDYQSFKFKTGVKRQVKIQTVSGKATVVIGVRRSGKSTLVHQMRDHLLASGIAKQCIVYLNFFDDRLHGLHETGLNIIHEAAYALYPDLQNRERRYYFFDELQMIPGWEPFVERLLRDDHHQVYITGSSAQLLSRQVATQMRGRALSWELFPFSFGEFLDHQRITRTMPWDSTQRRRIQKAFEDYWEQGGFPEVIGLERGLRIKIHQEYFNTLLFRDLIERYDIAHPRAVVDLGHWLINHCANSYTLNRLTTYLRELGHKCAKSQVADYLGWFEDAYFLFTVRMFDASFRRANANPKKIYCVDHAMISAISAGILVNSGHQLENLVFVALRRLSPEIFYFRGKNGCEVDFVVQMLDHSRLLIQVCESLQDLRTRKREVHGLTHAMEELGLDRGWIVTRNELEQIDNGHSRLIQVLPIWRFLLEWEHR